MDRLSPTPDDLRALSKDDGIALRDHQIEIAVAAALGDAGLVDQKAKTDEWVKRCARHMVPAKTLRCWKESTTPQTFVACEPSDADASPG